MKSPREVDLGGRGECGKKGGKMERGREGGREEFYPSFDKNPLPQTHLSRIMVCSSLTWSLASSTLSWWRSCCPLTCACRFQPSPSSAPPSPSSPSDVWLESTGLQLSLLLLISWYFRGNYKEPQRHTATCMRNIITHALYNTIRRCNIVAHA